MMSNTAGTANPGSLTLVKLREAMLLVAALPPLPRFHIVPVRRTPRHKLMDTLLVSPEFRREYDAWLIDFFGYNDHTILKPGQMIRTRQSSLLDFSPDEVVYIREDDYKRAFPSGVGSREP